MSIARVASIFSKLRSRYRIQTGSPQNVELLLSIQPVTQIDPLALVSRGEGRVVTFNAAETNTMHTPGAGEVWHLKRWHIAQLDGNIAWQAKIAAPTYGTPANQQHISLSAVHASGVEEDFFDLEGLVLRFGDELAVTSSSYVAEADMEGRLFFDLEDCAT